MQAERPASAICSVAESDETQLADRSEEPATHGKPDTAKRRQILKGAREIFLRDGFDNASMDDITAAAGVSKGTVYAYFDSKLILFETLIREDRRLNIAKIRGVTPEADSAELNFDVRAALVDLARQVIDVILKPDSIAALRMIIAVAPKFPHLGAAFFEEGILAGNLKLAGYFESLANSGCLKIENSALAASQFVNLCRGNMAMQCLLNVEPAISPEVVNDNIVAAVDMFLRIYRA